MSITSTSKSGPSVVRNVDSHLKGVAIFKNTSLFIMVLEKENSNVMLVAVGIQQRPHLKVTQGMSMGKLENVSIAIKFMALKKRLSEHIKWTHVMK